MKKDSLLKKRVAQKIKALPATPKNYYKGRRRWSTALPDNVLLFSRADRSKVDSNDLSTYFHHRWVLLVSMQGGATIQVDKVSRELSAGTILLIPPLHLHHYHNLNDKKLCWLFITFDWPGQTPPTGGELGPHTLSEKALAHLSALAELWRDDDLPSNTLLSAQVMAILLLMFPNIAAHAPVASGEENESALVAAIRREVTSQSGENLSISELARRVGMSSSHMRAEFRTHTGISLGRYLREWRLREAALLLSSKNLSVKETSERLGFRDIYAFSRAFSRALGVPPSSLRTGASRKN